MSNEELELMMLRRAESITSQRSLSGEIGYSVGKVNYVLKALIDKGLLKGERFLSSEKKSSYRYLLTDAGIKEKIALTRKFVESKKREYEVLQAELEVYETDMQTRVKND